MDDDIVTRLRAGDPLCRDGHIYEVWAIEAANEIQRLRLIVHRWNSCEQVSGELCGWDSEKTLCQFCKVTDHE